MYIEDMKPKAERVLRYCRCRRAAAASMRRRLWRQKWRSKEMVKRHDLRDWLIPSLIRREHRKAWWSSESDRKSIIGSSYSTMSSSISRRFHRRSFYENRTIPTSSTNWPVHRVLKLSSKTPMESTRLRSQRTTGCSAPSAKLQLRTHILKIQTIRDYRRFAHLQASCHDYRAAHRPPSRSSQSHCSTAASTPSSSAAALPSLSSNRSRKMRTRPHHPRTATQPVASRVAWKWACTATRRRTRLNFKIG